MNKTRSCDSIGFHSIERILISTLQYLNNNDA